MNSAVCFDCYAEQMPLPRGRNWGCLSRSQRCEKTGRREEVTAAGMVAGDVRKRRLRLGQVGEKTGKQTALQRRKAPKIEPAPRIRKGEKV